MLRSQVQFPDGYYSVNRQLQALPSGPLLDSFESWQLSRLSSLRPHTLPGAQGEHLTDSIAQFSFKYLLLSTMSASGLRAIYSSSTVMGIFCHCCYYNSSISTSPTGCPLYQLSRLNPLSSTQSWLLSHLKGIKSISAWALLNGSKGRLGMKMLACF